MNNNKYDKNRSLEKVTLCICPRCNKKHKERIFYTGNDKLLNDF